MDLQSTFVGELEAELEALQKRAAEAEAQSSALEETLKAGARTEGSAAAAVAAVAVDTPCLPLVSGQQLLLRAWSHCGCKSFQGRTRR